MSSTDLLVPLALQHKKFADEYMRTNEKRASAIVAGYSENSAGPQASRLLRRPDIQSYIASTLAKQLRQTPAEEVETRETLDTRIIAEMEAMAFANIADFIRIDEDGLPQVDFSTATPEQLRAITSVKTRSTRRFDGKGQHIATDNEATFSLADKYKGLELLGKHRGLFKAEEQRVIVDVADRLLNARRRVLLAADRENGAIESPGGGGAGV